MSNFEDPRAYKMANVFMLAYPYGLTRLMSSYYWPRKVVNGSHDNAWMGPPSAPDMSTLGVFEGNDTSCQNGWVSSRTIEPYFWDTIFIDPENKAFKYLKINKYINKYLNK